MSHVLARNRQAWCIKWPVVVGIAFSSEALNFSKRFLVVWSQNQNNETLSLPLFVFSISSPKQNATSLLTPVSDTVFNALSRGSLHFLLHGSSNNRFFQRFWLVVEKCWPIRKWLKKLPWTSKPRLPCERAWKSVSETDVKSGLAFCLGSPIEKTNSDTLYIHLYIYSLGSPGTPVTWFILEDRGAWISE